MVLVNMALQEKNGLTIETELVNKYGCFEGLFSPLLFAAKY